jgi:hypothetical protein
LLSTEVATLFPLGADAACSSCLKALALVALKLQVPDARGVAALMTAGLAPTTTAAEADALRVQKLAGVFFPDLRGAVENLLYIIEQEEAKASTKRNRETLAAARDAIWRLIGTRHVPTAKRFAETGATKAGSKKKGA